MAFCNLLQGIIKMVVLHGSLNKLTFKLDKNGFLISQNLILKYFQFEGFLKG
jgi:hypothetical protein